MTNRREELLRASQEAKRLVKQYDDETRSSFDILKPFEDLGIPVLFRPLVKMLGATVHVDNEASGVIVTTNRDLYVQRFTLAHELGHYLLGHKTRIDTEVEWSPRHGKGGTRPVEEDAAEAFASELLAPPIRIVRIAKRKQWQASDLKQSPTIYQLSLRLGISYQAACWALQGAKVLDGPTASALAKKTGAVKAAKTAIAPTHLEDPWANAWLVTEGDHDINLEAGPNDVFAVHIKERASAGYLWKLDGPSDCKIIDEMPPVLESPVGGPTMRRILVNFSSTGNHPLKWSERRPWNQHTRANLNVGIDNWGKEQAGLARRMRAALVGVPT
ncbi:MAG: ImmA/IrrE family metallo-endopeptidase [Halobacteriales archaeon]|nr:ImmA/IrrE family metallo-endopeptidase [Halobacteriales archaeon]